MVKFHGGDTGQEETRLGVPPNFPVKYLAAANGASCAENLDGTPPIAFLPGEALSQAVLLHFTPSAHADSP